MNIVIIKAEETDGEPLANLCAVTFRQSYGEFNTEEDMEDFISKNFNYEIQSNEIQDLNRIIYLAKVNDQVVGYAHLLKDYPEAGTIELKRIYVDVQFIGKKVGAKLLEECLKESKQLGFKKMSLGVWDQNYRAIYFYKKFSFEETGTCDFQIGKRVWNDFVMIKSF